MSALTERVLSEHRQRREYGTFGAYEHCTCGGWDWSDTDETLTFVSHLAEVTEAAVRAEVAADIECCAVRNIGGHPYDEFDRGLVRAARIARSTS